MFRGLATRATALSIATLGAYHFSSVQHQHSVQCEKHNHDKISRLRDTDYNLSVHHHGKAKVRVLKVRHEATSRGEKHSVSEYTVHTRLYNPHYSKVFTDEDNTDLVATDTQKNTVYIVAKRTKAETPENFGIDIAEHFLKQYPMLAAVQIEVEETLWERHIEDGVEHNHSFVKTAPEQNCATIRMCRNAGVEVTSEIRDMTILKTTQSGFEDYLLNDQYTVLPECTDRCLSTKLTAKWQYNARHVDYQRARESIRKELMTGLFGPSEAGVYSVSLQATIYDAACLALKAVPELEKINITTPNVHYLPVANLLTNVKTTRKGEEVRDVFQPTSEPSGMIYCEVTRKK